MYVSWGEIVMVRSALLRCSDKAFSSTTLARECFAGKGGLTLMRLREECRGVAVVTTAKVLLWGGDECFTVDAANNLVVSYN